MSLFSSLRKNKQESASDDGAFYSRAEEDSKAVRSRTRRRQGDQRDAAADQVLPEKKRARRRLIGAVALVLAAVIGLPMLLDAEPQSLPDDIAIRIPSKDKAIPLESERAVSSDLASSLEAKEEMVEPPPADAASSPAKSHPSDAAATIASHAKGGEASTAKQADADVARVPGKTNNGVADNAKAEAKTADRSDEAARAKALLEGKPDPKATEGKTGKFIIQVAALASKEKVEELQSKLKHSGIKSYTQTVATGSGERTRIRVGPFTSKEEAEKVRAKIVKLGLGGTVVPA